MTDDDTDSVEAFREFNRSLKRLTRLINRVAHKHGWKDDDAMIEDLETREIALRVETGIYDAELETPDGATFRLRDVYFWSRRMDGDRLVDVPEAQLPDRVPIEECRLTVFAGDGTPLFGGPLADEGVETIGENRCLQVENGRHDRE